MRTLVAFLAAPAAAPIIFGAMSAAERHEGMSRFDVFVQSAFVAMPLSYGLSYIFGTIVFAVLKWRRRESIGIYSACGAAVGIAYGLFVAVVSSDVTAGMLLAVLFGGLGLAVSTSFALIRGMKRKMPNSEALEPTAPSGRGSP